MPKKYAGRRGRPRKTKSVKRPRGLKQPVQYFTRSKYIPGAFAAAAGATNYDAAVARLVDVPSYTDFTNLYDQYKIISVKFAYLPRGNQADLGTSGSQITRLFSVLDYDDSVVPTSIDQLCEYQNLKMTNTSKAHVRSFQPRYIREIDTGLGATGKEVVRGGWIDCTNNNVTHRGIKLALQGPVVGTITYDLMITYKLAFKNVR